MQCLARALYAPPEAHDADVVYLYDEDFEGFLCCVSEGSPA